MTIRTELASDLKAATRKQHQTLESLPFAKQLSMGELPLTSYIGYLRGLATIHALIEHQIPQLNDVNLDLVWQADMAKLDRLMADISFHASPALGDIQGVSQATQKLANCILRRSVVNPLSLLGYLYVLEGSMLGAQVEVALHLSEGQD
jgi:heme oxygenase